MVEGYYGSDKMHSFECFSSHVHTLQYFRTTQKSYHRVRQHVAIKSYWARNILRCVHVVVYAYKVRSSRMCSFLLQQVTRVVLNVLVHTFTHYNIIVPPKNHITGYGNMLRYNCTGHARFCFVCM